MLRLCHGLALFGLACLAFAARPATAQDYPTRPLRIIAPQAAGGGFDTVARILGDRLSAVMGQPVVVEDRPGAGTVLGTDVAARAEPDGYTLLVGGVSNIALNVGLYPKLSYDPMRDFRVVGIVASWPFVLLTRNDLPFHSFADVVDAARASPGQLTYASTGRGSGQHIAGAVAFQLAGIELLHVPYSGAQAAYTDLLGGRVDLFFDNLSTALAQIRAGTVRPLAVSSTKRYPGLPDVPTVAETGLANLDLDSWFGLFVPAATPAPILSRLRGALEKTMADPATIALFQKAGATFERLTPEQSEAYSRSEITRWTPLVRAAGVSAD